MYCKLLKSGYERGSEPGNCSPVLGFGDPEFPLDSWQVSRSGYLTLSGILFYGPNDFGLSLVVNKIEPRKRMVNK
jgi:hypothetical protein